ncbi:ETS translocation variant 5, partial [Frankliniella fusca]
MVLFPLFFKASLTITLIASTVSSAAEKMRSSLAQPTLSRPLTPAPADVDDHVLGHEAAAAEELPDDGAVVGADPHVHGDLRPRRLGPRVQLSHGTGPNRRVKCLLRLLPIGHHVADRVPHLGVLLQEGAQLAHLLLRGGQHADHLVAVEGDGDAAALLGLLPGAGGVDAVPGGGRRWRRGRGPGERAEQQQQEQPQRAPAAAALHAEPNCAPIRGSFLEFEVCVRDYCYALLTYRGGDIAERELRPVLRLDRCDRLLGDGVLLSQMTGHECQDGDDNVLDEDLVLEAEALEEVLQSLALRGGHAHVHGAPLLAGLEPHVLAHGEELPLGARRHPEHRVADEVVAVAQGGHRQGGEQHRAEQHHGLWRRSPRSRFSPNCRAF